MVSALIDFEQGIYYRALVKQPSALKINQLGKEDGEECLDIGNSM